MIIETKYVTLKILKIEQISAQNEFDFHKAGILIRDLHG